MSNGRGQNLPAYTYFRCRTYGHAWFEYDSLGWTPSFGVPMTLRCERCGSERRDQVSRVTGDLVARNYSYAPGYQWSRDVDTDEPRPKTAVFRLMVLTNNAAEKPEAIRARTRKQMSIETPPDKEPSLRRGQS
jgi:hypothetical protein